MGSKVAATGNTNDWSEKERCPSCGERTLEEQTHPHDWQPTSGQKYFRMYWFKCKGCNKVVNDNAPLLPIAEWVKKTNDLTKAHDLLLNGYGLWIFRDNGWRVQVAEDFADFTVPIKVKNKLGEGKWVKLGDVLGNMTMFDIPCYICTYYSFP